LTEILIVQSFTGVGIPLISAPIFFLENYFPISLEKQFYELHLLKKTSTTSGWAREPKNRPGMVEAAEW
jgi:hypothetical protein